MEGCCGDGATGGARTWVRKAPSAPSAAARRQINGLNDCKIARRAEKPRSVTARWPPEGRQRPSHHLSQRPRQPGPPFRGLPPHAPPFFKPSAFGRERRPTRNNTTEPPPSRGGLPRLCFCVLPRLCHCSLRSHTHPSKARSGCGGLGWTPDAARHICSPPHPPGA